MMYFHVLVGSIHGESILAKFVAFSGRCFEIFLVFLLLGN